MTNVAFYRGTTTPTTSNLSDGGIYFNTSNKKIYMNSGGTLYTFDGNNTDTNTDYKASSYNTSSKIYLIGATSQSGSLSTGLQTYSHDTAYVGSDGKLYSGSSEVISKATSAWVTCNYAYNQISSVPAAAREIMVSWGCPIKNITEGDLTSTTKIYQIIVLHRCDRNSTGFSNTWQPSGTTVFLNYSNRLIAAGTLSYSNSYDTSGSWNWNGSVVYSTDSGASLKGGSSRCYGTTSSSYNSYTETFSALTIQGYRF